MAREVNERILTLSRVTFLANVVVVFFSGFDFTVLTAYKSAMAIYFFIPFTAVQIYDLSSIHLYSARFNGSITNSQNDQLPDGLITQLVEHCSGIAKHGHGFKSP